METVNLTNGMTSAVPLSGDTGNNILGFTYDASADQFLAANNASDWFTVTVGGLSTQVGTDTYGGEFSRGLAFVVPEPGSLTMLGLSGLTLGLLRRQRNRYRRD